MKHLFIICLIAFVTYATPGEQTDWSGGGGVTGPVSDWGNQFWSKAMINWSGQAGELCLEETEESYLIWQIDDLEWVKPCHMNNDEFPDVFVKRDGLDCAWYMNVDYGASWGYRPIENSEKVIDFGAADIDGDGDIDFFASTRPNPEDGFLWYERLNLGGTQWEIHLIEEISSAGRVAAVDMDSDGDFDLLGLHGASLGTDNEISWWENLNNGSSWQQHSIVTVPSGYLTSVDIADSDNDGDFDLVCGSDSDSLFFVEQVTNGTWSLYSTGFSCDGYLGNVAFSDVDADGLLDLVTCPAYSTPVVLWFRNTGNPENWVTYSVSISLDNAISVMASYINGDELLDFCVVGSSGYPLRAYSWMESVDPLNGVWTEHTLYEDSASGWAFSDLNIDGTVDVIACYRNYSNPNLNEAYWWNMSPGYYQGETYLESSLLYVYDVEWGSIDWSAVTLAGTSVSFQVRSSDDPSDLGEWSAILTSPCSLAPYLTTGDSYVQYRAILSTDDPEQTPVLESVSLSWTSTGIEGPEEPEVLSLEVLENPVSGSVMLGMNLPDTTEPTVLVFDTAGRLVETVSTGELPAGYSTVMIDHLRTGTYFCLVQHGRAEAVERFTVIQN